MIWHITPVNDLEEHEENSTCKCNPRSEVEPESGDILIIHSSYDGRELLEEILNEPSEADNSDFGGRGR